MSQTRDKSELLPAADRTRFSERGPTLIERLRGFQRYRITLEGYATVALMALVGFAAWHSGTNLLYLIFAMLVSIFLVHGITVGALLRKLEVTRRLPLHITAGEPAEITLVLRNRRRLLSSYGLRLMDHTARGENVGSAFALRVLPQEKVTTTYGTVFPRRGRFLLRRIEVSTRFPFALVERGFSTIHPQEVLVYPAMYEVQEVLAFLQAETGELEAQKKGQGYDYYGLREYAPGDPARLIHWRSSVRAQRLVVVEHEREERRQMTLLLMNLSPGGPAAPPEVCESFERAVSLTASLARHFLENQYEVQLITASGATPHASGQGQVYRILRTLADLQLVDKGRSIPPVLQGRTLVQVAFGSEAQAPGATLLHAAEWTISGIAFRRRSHQS